MRCGRGVVRKGLEDARTFKNMPETGRNARSGYQILGA